MSSEFDPYRIWLGIPVSEQPANLYRLLGLALFESDDDVISNAADRQMAHVRTFQTGKYSEQSQKLLNELSAARVTLLDKKKKAEYDAKLKSELDSSAGSSMVNLGNGAPPQGSFIGGQSSVNLAPPPINAPEGSLLGVNLGLSSTSKKKSGSSDKSVGGKSVKGASTSSYSGGKRASSKKKNNTGVIAGIVAAAAALVVGLILITSSSKHDEEEYDPNDYSQSEFFKHQAQLTQAPQQPSQQPVKPERPKPDKNRHKGDKKKDKAAEDTQNSDFELPPPVGDAPVVPETPPVSSEEKKADAESPENAAGEGTDVPVDFTQLAQTPGQVKVYDQIQAKPIEPFLLFQDGVKGEPAVNVINQSADSAHLLVGSPDGAKTSVVNIATGAEALSLVPPSSVGIFADCRESSDEQMYFLAVNPSKQKLRVYETDIVSDELASRPAASLKEYAMPNSFIFRYDANGQRKTETDVTNNAFVTFEGYQILQIAPPQKANAGWLAVSLTDGLIHIINLESGEDFMRFYPSDSEVPVPVWTKDNIEASKKTDTNVKKIFKVIKPSVVPTAMVFQSDKYLATGNSQGEAFVWDMDNDFSIVEDSDIYKLQKLTHVFSAQESSSPVINMRFDSDGQKLYIFWADGHVGVWDWKNNQVVKKAFVDQNVKYAQILADKYLLVQNVKGEVSVWTWNTEKVKQIGSFKRLTEQVIADPEKLLFWATASGSSDSKLTMYALPDDFVEAMNNPDFAKIFKAIVIYPVPEESQWEANMDKAETIILKRLKDLSDEQKKARINELVDKIPDENSVDPDLRYALYMACIKAMVQLKDADQALKLPDKVVREFDVDKTLLELEVYELLLEKADKYKEVPILANRMFPVFEKLLKDNTTKERKDKIKEVLTKLINKDSTSSITERARSLRSRCN